MTEHGTPGCPPTEPVAVLVTVNYVTGTAFATTFRGSEGHEDPHAAAHALLAGIGDDWPESEGWLSNVVLNEAANKIRAANLLKAMGLEGRA